MNETINNNEWETVGANDAVATVSASADDGWETVTDTTGIVIPDTAENINLGSIEVTASKADLINQEFEIQKKKIEEAKLKYPDYLDMYDASLARLERKKLEDLDKVKESELKLKQLEGKVNGFNESPIGQGIKEFGAGIAQGAEVGSRVLGESLSSIAVVSEDISNIVRDFVGAERDTQINDYIAKNKAELSKIQKEMGYEEGDFFSPVGLSRFATSIAESGLPFIKVGKLYNAATPTIKNITAAATGQELTSSIGQGKTYDESVQDAITTGALTYVGGHTINYIGGLIKGKEAMVLSRLKENLSMTAEEESKYYRQYANMIGKHSIELSSGEKATALAYANPDAMSILYHSLGRNAGVHSNFNSYARGLSENVKSMFSSGDEKTIQKGMLEVDSAYKKLWTDFENILTTNHDMDMVALPNNPRLKAMLINVAKKSDDATLEMMTRSGQISVPELLKAKKIVGDIVYGNKPMNMSTNEYLEFKNNKKIYDSISDLFDNNIPQPLQEAYTNVKEVTKLKKTADLKELMSRYVTEGANLEQKHVDSIVNEMKAKGEGSSYDSMMKLIGTNSTIANQTESILLKNIVSKNTKNGFTDFVKVFDNIKDVNFKTPEGKALKNIMEQYKSVFNNVDDIQLSQLGVSESGNSLTLNPAMRAAYVAHSYFYNGLTEFLGVTQKQRNMYLLKTLPDVLNTKTIPKAYSVAEQRGAVAFSRFQKHLDDIASRNPEEYEIGKKGKAYPSSQMIGETGANNMKDTTKADALDDAIRNFTEKDMKDNWKETKWVFDTVDDRWKFHLSGDDVKIKLGRSNIIKGGNYKLSDVIDMPNLFEAYPELSKTKLTIKYDPKNSNTLGHYVPATGEIMINTANAVNNKEMLVKSIKDTLVHEIQHGIQGIEGFASGGNTSRMTFKQYQSLHGEVEARALTKGGVGEYPIDIYDAEYKLGGLHRDINNKRGVPIGSTTKGKIIKPKKENMLKEYKY